MSLFSIAITLHLLGTIIWIGGMFFAHMALRPAAAELLEPPQRLPLLKAVLDRFFRWVWVAILLILVSGYWIFLGLFQANAMLSVHIMQGIGLLMVGLFVYLYFIPYRKMGPMLETGGIPMAAAQMAIIRRIIGLNLILGLITVVIGTVKPF